MLLAEQRRSVFTFPGPEDHVGCLVLYASFPFPVVEVG